MPRLAFVAPVTLARTVCPASKSFALVNPVTGNPGCPVRIPKSTGNVAVGLTERHTPLPNSALAKGDPLVVIELSLMIIPKFAPPLQLLG